MTIQELLQKLEASEELKAAIPAVQQILDQEAHSASQVKQLNRQIEVINVASKTGSNAQVLLDLLPQDITLNQDGTVTAQDGKTLSLVEYVKADPKLSLYHNSIFNTQAQTAPTQTTTVIPDSILSGRSQNTEPQTATAQALKQLKAQQTANAESILNRFK